MSELTLRSRNVSELVDASFSLYRRNASAYIMVSAIANVPSLIANILLLPSSPQAPSIATGINAFALMLVSLFTYALMNGVVTKLGSDVYLGGEANVGEAVRAVLPKVGTIIVTLFMRVILYFLGILCLFFGVFYVWSRWFAIDPAVVLENHSSSSSFSRSSQLSNGSKWHIFRTLLLGYGIYIILALGVMFTVAPLVGDSELMSTIIMTCFTIVAYPIIGLLTMLLYYDMRIRKEGFDVQHMATSLDSLPPRAV